MTSNFVPRFCTTCSNILGRTNANSIYIICSECRTQNTIVGKTIVIEEVCNKINQSMSDEVLKALAKSPTTDKIFNDCPSCGCDIMSKIHDKNFYNLVCDGCGNIYIPKAD